MTKVLNKHALGSSPLAIEPARPALPEHDRWAGSYGPFQGIGELE